MKLPALLVLTGLSVFSQSREDLWRADLDALRAHILRTHRNPFTRTPPDVFEQRVEAVRSRIPELTDAQVVVEFAGIVGMLNDGHSILSLVQPGTGVRRYPVVVVRWFSDGLYVTGAPAGAARRVGTRIVSMNGQPVEAVFEAVRPWLAYDPEEWARSESELMMIHEVLVAAGVAALGGALTLETEDPGGQRFAEETSLNAAAPTIGPVVARPSVQCAARTCCCECLLSLRRSWPSSASTSRRSGYSICATIRAATRSSSGRSTTTCKTP
jgi:hypothetical protein